MNERITSESGGQKEKKLEELGALDPRSLMEVAKVAGYGSKKYKRDNYRKGYLWSLSYDALQRHLHLFWSGQDHDEESGLPHLAHAAWHCLTLMFFARRHGKYDDRPVRWRVYAYRGGHKEILGRFESKRAALDYMQMQTEDDDKMKELSRKFPGGDMLVIDIEID